MEILCIAFTFVTFAFYGVACALDVQTSERGFAKGFEERNPIVRALLGVKPATWKLVAYNVAWAVLVSVPCMVWESMGLWAATMGLIAGAAGKHCVSAFYTWPKVEDGTYKEPTTAFAKFLGL